MNETGVDLDSILDEMLEGLQVVDRDFRYVYLNAAAAQHGRAERASLVGRTMMECYPGIEQTEMFAALRRCVEERRPHTMENHFTYPDGRSAWFELRMEPVPRGACILSIEVTARKLVEERLQVSQRMEAIGRLAAGVAHDFNNLLTVMMAQCQLALERPGGPQTEDVESVLAAARSSAQLTRQLLAYGRRTALAPEPLDLGTVLREQERVLRAVAASRTGPPVELRFEIPERVPAIAGDRTQIEQVILNLVTNARDAIAGAGSITLALTRVEVDDEYARVHPGARPGEHVVLVVSDTGAGMDAETRARIFEPFFTTKGPGRGTGLGLAAVYGTMQQHGGNVWVYSEPGRGTTFKLYFPVAQAAASPRPRSASRRPPAPTTGGPQLILVAEDDPLLRKLLVRVLEIAGHRVLAAPTGTEALQLFEARAAEVALLITDITMPGLSGPDLIARVRKRRGGLPVICTSGYSHSDREKMAAIPDGVVFVEKPFAPRALVSQVQALLGG